MSLFPCNRRWPRSLDLAASRLPSTPITVLSWVYPTSYSRRWRRLPLLNNIFHFYPIEERFWVLFDIARAATSLHGQAMSNSLAITQFAWQILLHCASIHFIELECSDLSSFTDPL